MPRSLPSRARSKGIGALIGEDGVIPGTRITKEPVEDEHPYFSMGPSPALRGHRFIPREKGAA